MHGEPAAAENTRQRPPPWELQPCSSHRQHSGQPGPASVCL